MFNWGETSVPTLGQQATENVAIFRQKKKDHIESCLQHLIETTKQEVLYQSSMGCKVANVGVVQEEKNFPDFVIGLEDRSEEYKLSNAERIYLLNELESHFTNVEMYPHLVCKRLIRGYAALKHCIRITITDPETRDLEARNLETRNLETRGLDELKTEES